MYLEICSAVTPCCSLVETGILYYYYTTLSGAVTWCNERWHDAALDIEQGIASNLHETRAVNVDSDRYTVCSVTGKVIHLRN